MVLKNLFRLIIIFLLFNLINFDDSDYSIYKKKIDEIIEDKIEINNYDGYLYIPKFEYKGLIETGDSKKVLDSNNIYHLENGSKIKDELGNTVLAGHNNRYVFSILYKLNIGDELIVYDKEIKYKFSVYKIETVNITDIYVLDNLSDKKILTLITCTKNNQKRLVVRGTLKIT